MTIVKELTQEEKDHLIELFRNVGATYDDVAERMAVIYQTGPIMVIPVSEQAKRHAYEKMVESGTITRKEFHYRLDDPSHSHLILVHRPNLDDELQGYGTEQDWLDIAEALNG